MKLLLASLINARIVTSARAHRSPPNHDMADIRPDILEMIKEEQKVGLQRERKKIGRSEREKENRARERERERENRQESSRAQTLPRRAQNLLRRA